MQNEHPTGFALTLLLISASLATFMSALDGTIVNIALPTIAESFDLSSSSVAWVSTIYLLVMAGFLLIIGKISDVIGFKKIFLAGFILFTIGSFTCGFLPDFTGQFSTLLGSRALQAVGGAMMTVIAPAMLSYYMPGDRKAKGMSLVILFASVGMALGPTLGGYLTEYLSWHWIFFINVPIGIFAVILGYFAIPGSAGNKSSLKGFDTLGAVLVFVGLASLLFAFSEGFSLGWTSATILVSLALAVIGIGGFLWRELHYKNPLLDLSLFRSRSFIILNLLVVLLFFTFAGVNYLLPFYLQHVHNYSTSFSGLIITAMSVGMMVSGVLAGLIYAKLVGKIRYLVMAGVALLVIGFLLLTDLNATTDLGQIVLSLALIGFGLGLTTTSLTTLIMNAAPQSKQGMVSSITGLERFAPMTIGVAVYNIIFVYGIISAVQNSGITEMPPASIAADILSYGFDLAFIVSVGLSILLFILCIFIREERAVEE
ncbi:DHA2 family efflux MFS transporter permease subunit [Methanorbis furvi]|uniref:Multidrug resistance protein Stp n=1 Tax=Methanorbis furvi TaxID=3028299 RepID=A0AAE4MBZ1_9EURY|nr:Multidrug resistance protein Stp [Methanocorpusculaceae archaeon Ag1]